MKLVELFKTQSPPEPDYPAFLTTFRPPLETPAISIEALAGSQRARLKTVTDGDASLLLRYKKHEGAVTSITEKDNGDVWNITQVQGASGRKAFRLASGLRWQQLLGTRIETYAHDPEAEVRHITMPLLGEILNIDGAVSETVDRTYALVRSALGMRFSKEHGLYIADVNPP